MAIPQDIDILRVGIEWVRALPIHECIYVGVASLLRSLSQLLRHLGSHAQGAVLEHLCIADAHVHSPCGLFDRTGLGGSAARGCDDSDPGGRPVSCSSDWGGTRRVGSRRLH